MKLWLKKKLTFSDTGNSWNPMMCRCNSQITSDCWPTTTHPSHPLPPPPRSGAPHLSHTSSLITVLFVASHLAIQGVSFDINYWHNLCLSTLSCAFPFRMTFHTFMQHFFAEKCTLPLPDNNFEKSFSRSFSIAFTLLWTYANNLFQRNKNAPVILLGQSY